MVYLGVDVGGTKIAAGLVDGDGRVLRRQQVPTPPGDGDAVVAALLSCASSVLDGARPDGVGVGCAGPVDIARGTVSPLNIPGWRDYPLVDRVSSAFPDVPVRLAGDGVCMALGEHWSGAGVGVDAMVGIVVSTGVGGGLVLDGRAFPGRSGNAGHFGHLVVEDDGPECPCGGRGCVESVASGRSMVRWATEQGWVGQDAAALAESARAGDPVASAAFRRAGRAVGMAVAGAAVLCDLQIAVIGGGVAKAGDLLFAPLREAVADHIGLSYALDMEIVPALLGGDAGIVGAAALVGR